MKKDIEENITKLNKVENNIKNYIKSQKKLKKEE